MDLIWRYGAYFLLLELALSVASFVAYGIDKRLAQRQSSRISEKTLHTIDLVGGWPGGWLGRRTFHHKTIKRSFVVRFWLTVLAHLVVVGLLLWLAS